MMENIKVALSSASSQGKTTLLNRLSLDPFLAEKNFHFQTSTVRDITKHFNIKVNELGDDMAQILVMAKHIENAYKPGNWILDRCILDSLVYGISSKTSKDTLTVNTQVLKQLLPKYDLIFYIEPELFVVDDGFRNTDKQFFLHSIHNFEKTIAENDVPVIRLAGTVEERYNKVIQEIKKLYE